MKSLAVGIERDRAAVVAALAYEWSNGATEGRINRVLAATEREKGKKRFQPRCA